MKKVLFFIAPGNFRDEELFETKKIIEKEGIKSDIGSTINGEVTGMLGKKVYIDYSISEIDLDEYKAIIFVGGRGVLEYRLDEDDKVLELARKAKENNLLVCAICVAPRILANAGLLKDKKATVFNDRTSIEILKKGKAIYTGNNVEIDKRIITADGPNSSEKFGKKILENL